MMRFYDGLAGTTARPPRPYIVRPTTGKRARWG